MEGGTLAGFAVAGAAGLLVAGGSVLARGRCRAPGHWHVIGTTLLMALVAAVCGVVVIGVGTDAFLEATAPSCPFSGEGNAACVELDNVGKQAAAMGLLGGIGAGVLAGLVTAWRMSRSLRLVLGGLIATLGATVLLAESIVVLILWAG
jgi:hypothetical protein